MISTNELTMRARGIASRLTYNEEPEGSAKHMLHELAHRLDARDVKVKGGSVRNGLGKSRRMTLRERVAFRLFGSVPERV